MKPIPSMWLLTLAVFSPIASAAQETVPLDVGTRVRVTLLNDERVLGELLERPRAHIALRRGNGSRVNLELDRILTIDRSISRNDRAGTGALIGGGIGVSIGATLGVGVAGAFCELESCTGTRIKAGLAGGALFGLGGALLGALVGVLASTETWESTWTRPPRDGPRLHFAAGPAGGGGLFAGFRLSP